MKKTLLIVAVLSITVLTFGIFGYAYAQGQTTPSSGYPYGSGMMGDNTGYGRYSHGMMSGFGGHGMMDWNGEGGPMHDAMITALADALGLSIDEIAARHDAGETLWEIAEAEGLSIEEIQELMFSAHNDALDDAVANGWLTQEQAEWMDTHMEQMWDGGSHCDGNFGTRGRRGSMTW